jgi:hypothetical protein
MITWSIDFCNITRIVNIISLSWPMYGLNSWRCEIKHLVETVYNLQSSVGVVKATSTRPVIFSSPVGIDTWLDRIEGSRRTRTRRKDQI